MVLLNMGVEVEELRSTTRYHIKTILTNLSREVSRRGMGMKARLRENLYTLIAQIYSKLAVPGISDGEGLKAEVNIHKLFSPDMYSVVL